MYRGAVESPVRPRKHNPPPWSQRMGQISRLPDGSLLDALLDPSSGFKTFLSTFLRDPNTTRIAVTVLERASSATTFPSEKLIELLSAVAFSEKFMLFQLPFLLLHCKDVGRQESIDILQRLVSLLTRLQAALPATTARHLVTLLPSVKELETSLKYDLSRDVTDSLKELEAMKDSFLAETHSRELLKQERLHASAPPDNFRDIPVIPITAELVGGAKPFLRPNIVRGTYADVDHYLDVQYRLLREDFVRPLRQGLQKLLQSDMKITRVDDINVYRNVQILESRITRGGIVHELLFDVSGFRKVNWERSKRFMNENLLCLSNDGFKTIWFATVKTRDPNKLKRGSVTVLFAETFVETVTWNRYTVVETQIYFEAYKHILVALQELRAGALPFCQYLVKANPEVSHPAYMDSSTRYDIMSLCNPSCTFVDIPVLNNDLWPSLEHLKLDESQLAAVKMALQKEFSVIQGPPGTGKTYIGLKIVEVLLRNREVWRRGDVLRHGHPILVVCYTNHALDQFLEEILKTTKGIVRIGGRCSCESLEPYTLFKLRTHQAMNRGYEARDRRVILEWHLEKTTLQMSSIYAVGCMFEDLAKQMSPLVQKSFETRAYAISKGFGTWLEMGTLKTEFMAEFVARRNDVNSQGDHGSEHEQEEDFDEELLRMRFDDDELFRRDARVDGDAPNTAAKTSEGNITKIDEEEAWCLHLYQLVSDGDRAEGDEEVTNVWKLPVKERWRLYRYWVSKAVAEMQEVVAVAKAEMSEIKEVMAKEQLEADLVILNDALVVGATTTGAAKNRALIQQLQPTIVIVEEAAEVLEAHVVTSLTSRTQHLILIGDHKQLRPSSAVYELATRYNMEVSLFERMLTNGMACQQLDVQHRMRPEFTKLLVPHFYEKLENFPSVEAYENIRGMDKNMFFLTHNAFEENEADTKSHTNIHEARFVIALAEYLLHQEYSPTQITILTPYSGQMFILKKLAKNGAAQNVRITVVDNFQGEENDIIILSFVRSNPQKKVGFVKISNRICVSLSRAKKGLYCVGNFDVIGQSSDIWKNIVKELEDQTAIGPELQLRCPNHPATLTTVKTAEDFAMVPEGGCGIQCTFRLDCGHSCDLLCHGYDRLHEKFPCKKKCERTCYNGHGCRKRCSEECEECYIPVLTVFVPCGHSREIPCRLTREPCCPLPCAVVLNCGHKCLNTCGETCVSQCQELVPVKGECGHDICIECYKTGTGIAYEFRNPACTRHCYDLLRDLQQCTVDCFCTSMVMASGMCGHESEVPCPLSKAPDLIAKRCNYPCKRQFSCGHTCPKKCKETCPNYCEVQVTVKCMRGHQDSISCRRSTHYLCEKECCETLECGHLCREVCSDPCTCNETVQIMLDCHHFIEVECWERNSATARMRPCVAVVNAECGSGHVVSVRCSEANDVTKVNALCRSRCSKTLPCGHQCTLKCRDSCGSKDCTVETAVDLRCGHKIGIPCHLASRLESPNNKQRELQTFYVEQKTLLQCTRLVQASCEVGHQVMAPCFSLEGSKILPRSLCSARCDATFPCGHLCQDICSKPCGICKERCQSLCIHRYCNLDCGYPCVPCPLPCRWKCEHFKCTAMCSEPCNREPCNKPCKKKLPCKHPCLGYCGEPCPDVCKVCKGSGYLENAEDDCRFVLLLDCRHSVPDRILSPLFQEAKRIHAGPVGCPACKRKITFNFRYGTSVREYMDRINLDKTAFYEQTSEACAASRSPKKKNDRALLVPSPFYFNLRGNRKRGNRRAGQEATPSSPGPWRQDGNKRGNRRGEQEATPSSPGPWRQDGNKRGNRRGEQEATPSSPGSWRQDGNKRGYNSRVATSGASRGGQFHGYMVSRFRPRGNDRGVQRGGRGGEQPRGFPDAHFYCVPEGTHQDAFKIGDFRASNEDVNQIGVSWRGGFSGRPRGRGRGGRGRRPRGGRRGW